MTFLFSKPIKLKFKTIKDKDSDVFMFNGDSLLLFNKGDKLHPTMLIDMVKDREFIIHVNPYKFPEWDHTKKNFKIVTKDKLEVKK